MPESLVTKSSFALALLLSVARLAHAEDRCVLRGEPAIPEGVGIYDAPTDGTEIGHFTGTKTALALTSFPDAASGRSGIETVGFRLKGFVRARDIPAYTARPVPVYSGHLSIGEGRKVVVIGSAPGRLHVEKVLTSPISGTFQGWAPCDAVSLSPKVPPGWTPPGGARGYVVKRPKIDLFAETHGDLVATLSRGADAAKVLFWGGEPTDGFVHVEYHGDLLIDAWARAQDLSALPPGETMDQLAPGAPQPGVARIQMQGRAKVVRAASAVLLHSAATDAAVVIGGIDAGVDVVVVDVVAGWASVLPVSLSIAPSGAAQFWVRARDLGI
jgi:hypothetical protein